METNTLVADGPSPAGFAGVLNFEQTRLNLTGKRDLWPGGEGGVELPLFYGWGGALDSFVDAFEHLLTPAKLMGHPLNQSATRPTPSPDAGGRKGEGADAMALSHFLCKAQ